MSWTEFLGRHREVSGLGADAVAEVAALVFLPRIDRQLDLVEHEAGVVGLGGIAHVVEHEELGLGSEIDGVADAHRLDHGFGLAGDAAGIAVIGLAGGGLEDVADQHQGGLGEERVDGRRRRGRASGTCPNSLIAFQPAIEEPSNIWPSEKVSSSIIPMSKVTCCHLPRGSVNRRSAVLHVVVLDHLQDIFGRRHVVGSLLTRSGLARREARRSLIRRRGKFFGYCTASPCRAMSRPSRSMSEVTRRPIDER